MKTYVHRVFMATLLAAGVSAASAWAQTSAYKATFDLPHETLWAGNVLEAGHYTLWLRSELSGAPFVHISGPSGEIAIIAGTHDYAHPTEGAHLKLVESNGAWVVSELDTGDMAKTFTFRVPKTRHAELASNRKAAPREALVSVNGGQ